MPTDDPTPRRVKRCLLVTRGSGRPTVADERRGMNGGALMCEIERLKKTKWA